MAEWNQIDNKQVSDNLRKKDDANVSAVIRANSFKSTLALVATIVAFCVDASAIVLLLVFGYEIVSLTLLCVFAAVELGFIVWRMVARLNIGSMSIIFLYNGAFLLPLAAYLYAALAVGLWGFLIVAVIRAAVQACIVAVSLLNVGLDEQKRNSINKKSSVIISVAMLLCVATPVYGALFSPTTGVVGEFGRSAVYSVDERTGELTLEYFLPGFSTPEVPKTATVFTDGKFVSGTVTTLGKDAFSNVDGVESIKLPNSVNKIDARLFSTGSVKSLEVTSDSISLFNDNDDSISGEIVLLNENICDIEYSLNLSSNIHFTVDRDNIDSYRKKYAAMEDRFAPELKQGELFINYNNSEFPTAIVKVEADGYVTVSDPTENIDTSRMENGREQRFIWWRLSNDGNVEAATFPLRTKTSLNLYATWASVYKISYALSGGEAKGTLTDEYYYSCGEIVLPSVEKDGYEFIGWYEEGKGLSKAERNSYLTSIKDTDTTDYRLYAKFLRKYTVAVDCVLPTAEHAKYIEYYHEWMDDITLSKPTCKGYTFNGWDNQQSGFIASGSTGDKRFVAQWKILAPTVSQQNAAYSHAYDGEKHELKVTPSSSAANVHYSYVWKKGADKLDDTVDTVAVKNVADSAAYTCTVTIADEFGNDNFTHAVFNVKIDYKNVAVAAANQTITYGDVVPAVTASFVDGDFVGGDTSSVVTGTPTAATLYEQYGKVGSYTISVDVSMLSADNYSFVAQNGTLTVRQREIGIQWPTNTEFSYNGYVQAPTATATGLVNNDTCDLTVKGGQKNSNYGGSPYTATVSDLSNGNYKLPQDVTVQFNINRVALSVTANAHTITYGDAPSNNGAVYKGLVGDDTEASLGTLQYGYTYARNQSISEGPFFIWLSGLSEQNYDITYHDGTLTVEEKDISNATIEFTDELTYNGSEQEIRFTVTVDGLRVTCNANGSNIARTAGKHELTVEGYGNFKGTCKKEFTIAKRIIAAPPADARTFTYSKQPHTYNISDTENYTVRGNTQTNAGTYDVTVSLKDPDNNEWAKGDTADKIYKFIISKAKVEIPTAGAPLVYNGRAQTYSFAQSELYTISGATQTAAGKYNATAKLQDGDNYEWVKSGVSQGSDDVQIKYEISRRSIADATVEYEALTYNGAEQEVTFDVKIEGVDGNIEYSLQESNKVKDAKEYTFNLSGTGNFDGSKTVKVIVSPKDISQRAQIDFTNTLTYNGRELTIEFTVTVDGLNVSTSEFDVLENSDKATNAGEYTLKIQGKGNFTGESTKSFNVAKRKVSAPSANTSTFTYNGKEQTYTITGSDYYTITGDKRTDAGNQHVTVTLIDTENNEWATGGSDPIIFTFKIEPKNISGANITLNGSLTYDGSEKTQGISSVIIDGLTVTTYNVTGNTGTDAKSYELTVEGTENFCGQATIGWSITPATITNVAVTGYNSTFDGNVHNADVSSSASTLGEQIYIFMFGMEYGAYNYEHITVRNVSDSKTYYYKVSANNHNDYFGSFTVTIDKATVSIPVVGSKVYTGSKLTADIESTDKYDVVQNDGGITAGEYDVVLRLNDADNYRWNGRDGDTVTVKFVITKVKLTRPTTEDLRYDESSQRYEYTGDSSDILCEDDGFGEGVHNVTISIRDKDNYEWADGGNDDIMFELTVSE